MSTPFVVTHVQHLIDLRMGGKVQRYHTSRVNHRENNAEHSHGVALICLAFWPDTSCRLLKAALLHDLHELTTGDMPHTVKRDNPTLNKALLVAEANAMHGMGTHPAINALTADEVDRLKVADVADAFMYGRDEYLSGNVVVGRQIMRNSVLALDKYPNIVPMWFKAHAVDLMRTLSVEV